MAHRWSHLCLLTADGHIVPAKHLPDRYADEIRIQQSGKSTCFSVVLSPHVEDPSCPTISFTGASWCGEGIAWLYKKGLQLVHWIWHRNSTPLMSDTRTHARSLESGPLIFNQLFFLITKEGCFFVVLFHAAPSFNRTPSCSSHSSLKHILSFRANLFLSLHYIFSRCLSLWKGVPFTD